MKFYLTDCESLWSQLKREDKLLKSKRRWLLGLPPTNSKHDQSEEPKFFKRRCLPESLLREDDVFYEILKESVKEAFEVRREIDSTFVENRTKAIERPKVIRLLISHLDDFSNEGLFLLATTLTAGSIKFEETRWKMKKLISESLQRMSKNQNQDDSHGELFTLLAQILNNPGLFQVGSMTSFTLASHSHCDAAYKILDRLEGFPLHTLITMHRKLRGVRGNTPQLQTRRSGWNRQRLINHVRRACENMLAKLEEGDKLPESLAKAMAVAGLSLKLSRGFQNSAVTEFYRFSPYVTSLQNEIAKAVWLINKKVRTSELKELQHLLDPNAEIPNGGLRNAIKKMLIEYLFECNDIGNHPEYLLETLAIINRSSRNVPPRCFPKVEIEEEVECILSMSAQAKQILLDLLPDHEFDEEFNDALMEELVESDDSDDDDPPGLNNLLNSRSHFKDSSDQVESIGESLFGQKIPSFTELNENQVRSIGGFGASTSKRNGLSLQILPSVRLDDDSISMQEVKEEILMDSATSQNPFSFDLSKQTSSMPGSSPRNQYLAMQEVCDASSMVAYKLVGRVLGEYAHIEGLSLDLNDESYLNGSYSVPKDSEADREKQSSAADDIEGLFIVRVVEELLPSFPESGKERLEELMSLL